MPAGDSALTAVLPSGDGIKARMLLRRRLEGGRGRVVERLTLRSGRRVVVKARNDRVRDREALVYRRLLPPAGELAPAYLGSTSVEGVHLLALDDVGGRPCSPSSSGDRERAMAALARFHRAFPGSSAAAILGRTAAPELAAEATPDPIDQPGLLGNYRDALTRLAAVLPDSAYRLAEECADTVAAAIAASPLLFDPGDVRPENVLLAPGRTVLLDFENAAIRRAALALAAMLAHWPETEDLLRRYLAHGEEPPDAIAPPVRAGQAWLAVRDGATRVAGGTAVSPGLVRRFLLWLGR